MVLAQLISQYACRRGVYSHLQYTVALTCDVSVFTTDSLLNWLSMYCLRTVADINIYSGSLQYSPDLFICFA